MNIYLHHAEDSLINQSSSLLLSTFTALLIKVKSSRNHQIFLHPFELCKTWLVHSRFFLFCIYNRSSEYIIATQEVLFAEFVFHETLHYRHILTKKIVGSQVFLVHYKIWTNCFQNFWFIGYFISFYDRRVSAKLWLGSG